MVSQRNKVVSQRKKGHSTGMAGEFCVMERLFRLGHEPSLTLGNAKAIDIYTRAPSGKVYQVSVKAIRGGGKWGVGDFDIPKFDNLVFVLLWFKKFDDVKTPPEAWVIPGSDVERLKKDWFNSYAIYCSNKEYRKMLEPYEESWDKFLI